MIIADNWDKMKYYGTELCIFFIKRSAATLERYQRLEIKGVIDTSYWKLISYIANNDVSAL